MKKVLSVLLALVMMLSLSVVAFADDVISDLADLQSAFANGGDYVLGANISVTTTLELPAGKTLSIDLAGFDITGTGFSGKNLIHIANGGTLNVTDSSADESGVIGLTATGVSNTIWVEGKLNLYSGTISYTDETYSDISYAVDVHPSAWGAEYTESTEFNMYGGAVSSSTYGVRVANYSSETYEDLTTSFVMEDGSISSGWAAIFVQQPEGEYDKLSVEIKDGSVSSYYQAIQVYGPAATNPDEADDSINISVSGGTFEGTFTVSSDIPSDSMDYEITGGDFATAPPAELVADDAIISVDGTLMEKDASGNLVEADTSATSIALDKSALSLTEGESDDLVATVEPSYTTDVVTWASSDESVATVDQNGKVTAVKKGAAVITATAGDVSASCDVTVDCDHEIVKACDKDFHVDYCTKCKTELGERESHEFGEWEVTKAPTKIHKGERVHVCDVCDYEEVETLSRVSSEDEGHLVIPESQKPAEDKDTGKANPATGSVEFVNVAIALGTVSLAAAAAVVLKK